VSLSKRTGTSNSKPAVMATPAPGAVAVAKVMTPVVVSSVQPDICSTMPSATRMLPETGLAIVRAHVCAPEV
jgi:hypothetical protein